MSSLFALAAIALWATLAWLGVRLAAVPPFLLVGTALTIAGVVALPTWRQWRVSWPVFALGIYGLFGFHFLLFVALRLAPPLQANLVNYLWPLLMVLLAPLVLRDVRLTRRHVIGGVLGLAGAGIAITGGRAIEGPGPVGGEVVMGYAAALSSALVWATYSLLCQRSRQAGSPFPTAAIGLFCLSSGIAALACHVVLEPHYAFTTHDGAPLAALALGPMGAAFFLWDAALVRGDARTIATLAYLTPVLSTMLLGLSDPTRFGWTTVVALLLVVGGAIVGSRPTPPERTVRPDRPTGRARPRR